MTTRRRVWKGIGITLAALVLGMVGLVGYAAARGGAALARPETLGPELAASRDPALIEEGRYLVHGPAHCAQCHSASDRAHPEQIRDTPLRGGLAFAMGPLGTRYARNLTPHATGIAGLSDAQLARAIRTGVTHDGEVSLLMRYSGARLSDHDLVAVMSYLRSLEPVANEVPAGEWTAVAGIVFTLVLPEITPHPVEGPAHVPAGEAPSVARGRYLAENVMMCAACHTAMDPETLAFTGRPYAGSLPEPSHGADHDKEFVAPNLTPHATGITGQWSEDQFVARLRGGRIHISSLMPWENVSSTNENDLRSVYRFLRTVAPVETNLGPSYRQLGWHPPSR